MTTETAPVSQPTQQQIAIDPVASMFKNRAEQAEQRELIYAVQMRDMVQSLNLQAVEVKTLRSQLEVMTAERDALRADVSGAAE